MFSISHEQAQSKVFWFQNVDALFPKDHFFQIILYVMVICISALKMMRIKFFQNKLYLQLLQLFGTTKTINNNLRLLHSVKTLHGHS